MLMKIMKTIIYYAIPSLTIVIFGIFLSLGDELKQPRRPTEDVQKYIKMLRHLRVTLREGFLLNLCWV